MEKYEPKIGDLVTIREDYNKAGKYLVAGLIIEAKGFRSSAYNKVYWLKIECPDGLVPIQASSWPTRALRKISTP